MHVVAARALGSLGETLVIVGTLPTALVGGMLALLLAGETWNVPPWSV